MMTEWVVYDSEEEKLIAMHYLKLWKKFKEKSAALWGLELLKEEILNAPESIGCKLSFRLKNEIS